MIFPVALGLLAPLSAAIGDPVRISSGLVSGVPGTDASVRVFKGIPFAAPPVGDLRWKAPKLPAGWQGVRKADQFSASCIQTIMEETKPWTKEFMPHGAISEDCLYLNVWTAAKTPNDKRPVFFWIHGGGNTGGSTSVALYDGEELAKRGVVLVSINYRVGLFGFFTHPELTQESDYRASGDYGLLDQVAALRWVHDNIAAFGGDPNRVTIAGQSAGATDVHQLTASPLAKGLFRAAIAQSGSAVNSPAMSGRPRADQEKDGVRFAEAKGAGSLAALRAMSWQDLMAPVPSSTGATGGRGGPPWRFTVVVDGHFLPASVAETFAQGKQNDVPTITGCAADEGGGVPHPNITPEAFEQRIHQRFQDMADAFLKLYPAASPVEAGQSLNDSSRDQQRVAMYLWAMNRAKTAKTKAYTYFWDHVLPGPEADKYGAFHSSELTYEFVSFNHSDRPFTDADRKIAQVISSYWVNFTKTGNPNGKGLPHWPAVSEQPATTMEIGDKDAPIPIATSKARQEALEKYFATPRPPAPLESGR